MIDGIRRICENHGKIYQTRMPEILRSLFLSTVIITVFVGCDKPKLLNAEQATLDAQRAQVQSQIQIYEQKLAARGNSGMNLAQAAEVLKTAEAAEQTAAAQLQKWTEIEKKFAPLRDKATAYKAKYLR